MAHPVSAFKLPGLDSLKAQTIEALTESPALPLSNLPELEGRGVYAIYYRGEERLYNMAPELFKSAPLYVGKAIATGSRKGILQKPRSLGSRLAQHCKSLRAAGFDLTDFEAKVLPVDASAESLIPAFESWAIQEYTPLWNSVLDGFGNHDPGKTRLAQAPSAWDILHPGRAFAEKLTGESTSTELLLDKVKAHLS